nr:lipoprotein insertase outer membrane protein LolB [Sodalis sp. CWE]
MYTPPEAIRNQILSEKWKLHKQSLSKLSSYQVRGALSFLSDKKKVFARFNWQQKNDKCYRLILTNLLGSTELDLNINQGTVQLINDQGKYYIGSNPEVALQKLINMPIPLNELREWLIGLPGSSTNFTLNSNGLIYVLNSDVNGYFWTVVYHGYYENTLVTLPSSLELRQGNNRIKLKIDSWKL